MTDLYEPSMSENGLRVQLISHGPVEIFADAALIHRMVANLLDNERQAPAGRLHPHHRIAGRGMTQPGSSLRQWPRVRYRRTAHLFERRVKGRDSNGHGWASPSWNAVAPRPWRNVTASNRGSRGARHRGQPSLAEGSTLPRQLRRSLLQADFRGRSRFSAAKQEGRCEQSSNCPGRCSPTAARQRFHQRFMRSSCSSIDSTSLNCVRQRSRLLTRRCTLKYVSPAR